MKHGRPAETQDAEMPGEGRDFFPRDDREDAFFLQKKRSMKYFSRAS